MRVLILALAALLMLQGCGDVRSVTLRAEWQTGRDGERLGELQILLPTGTTEDEVHTVAKKSLTEARREGSVDYLAIDFTDTSIYYGARYNLARVEYCPRRGESDDAPLEPGGLAAHWVVRDKLVHPGKARPSDDEIRYYGLTWKLLSGARLSPPEESFLQRFGARYSAEQLEQLYFGVQAWLFD